MGIYMALLIEGYNRFVSDFLFIKGVWYIALKNFSNYFIQEASRQSQYKILSKDNLFKSTIYRIQSKIILNYWYVYSIDVHARAPARR